MTPGPDLAEPSPATIARYLFGKRRTTMPEHTHDDPREAGGDVVGPGGPHDRGAVTFDTRRAVIVDGWQAAIAHPTAGGLPQPDAVALVVEGRLNRPPDTNRQAERPAERVRYLNLMDLDAAANLVADLHALAARNGNADEFNALVRRHYHALEAGDLTAEAPRGDG